MPSSTVLFPSRTGVSDAPLLYILGYYHVHFFRGYKFTFLFLRKIVFLFFPHYIRISYIHQHPLIPRGPIESFSLLYLHEPFTFMSICYRHFIFSYLLVFFLQKNPFTLIFLHHIKHISSTPIHSPLPLTILIHCTIQMSLAFC